MLQHRLSLTLTIMLCAAACGGAKSPTAPESTATPPVGAGAAPGGATITGTVLSGAASTLTSAGSGAAMTGLVVTVAGTSVSSGLDAAGRFSLSGVPPGNVRLEFSGPVSATLPVNEVRPSETITMVVNVTPSSVVVESQLRSAGGEEQVEGRIESLPPAMPAGSLKVAGRTIATDASTVIRDETGARAFSDLAIGQRVHVKGRSSAASLLAASILIQDAVVDDDDDGEDDDEDDGQDESASIHGTLTALTGTTPNFTLTVGGTTVRTNADTTVKRRGDVQTLAALTVGQDLHVVGERQSNGSLDARKIEINGDAPGGAFEIEGPVGGLQGGCPVVTFKVNGYQVRTNAETKFESVTCAALKSGDKVQVRGKAEAGGTVVAEIVKKK